MTRTGNKRMGSQALLIPAAAGHEFVDGTMAAINADGYAIPAAKQAGLRVAGCIQRYLDTRLDSADGDNQVSVSRGAYVWANDGTVKTTDMLRPCYVADGKTVSMTAEGSSQAGTILAVDPDGITVDMGGGQS